MPHSSGRSRARRWVSPLAALLVSVLALPLAMASGASAAPGDPQYLTLTKTVSQRELAPGDTYTYRVQVTCSEASCLDAVLDDSLGELAGHALTNVTFKPSAPALTYAASWTSGGSTGTTAPAVVAADSALRVEFTQPTVSPTGTGIQAGQTFTVEMELRVPTTLAPGTDVTLDNVATVSATNSASASGTATVHVVVPIVVDVATTKSWTPPSHAFQIGARSTISLAATNAANVAVDRLVLQEPAVATEGATALPTTNPFTIVDLAALATTSVPAGCTAVTVDAYVNRSGHWTWVTGTSGDPADGLGLPYGVASQEVAGLRITCEGSDARRVTARGPARRRAAHRAPYVGHGPVDGDPQRRERRLGHRRAGGLDRRDANGGRHAPGGAGAAGHRCHQVVHAVAGLGRAVEHPDPRRHAGLRRRGDRAADQ